MHNQIPITLIGTGNVATVVGNELARKGFTIVQVFGRTHSQAAELAQQLQSTAISDLGALTNHDGLFLVCVSDSAIEMVSSALPFEPTYIAHTSGSMPVDALKKGRHKGLFYLLQTFSKSKPNVDFSEIPICLEGSSKFFDFALPIASSLSNSVAQLTYEQRQALHVAAVFACNFSNHVNKLAQDILQKANLNAQLLGPLVKETFSKLAVMPATEAQTGPAKRNDLVTLAKHQAFLHEQHPELLALYQLLSDSIKNPE